MGSGACVPPLNTIASPLVAGGAAGALRAGTRSIVVGDCGRPGRGAFVEKLAARGVRPEAGRVGRWGGGERTGRQLELGGLFTGVAPPVLLGRPGEQYSAQQQNSRTDNQTLPEDKARASIESLGRRWGGNGRVRRRESCCVDDTTLPIGLLASSISASNYV